MLHCRIKWKKDGREYLTVPGKSSTTEIRELDRVTSKLRIGDSAQGDAGRYSCEAENAYGKSHFSIDVTIWGELMAFSFFLSCITRNWHLLQSRLQPRGTSPSWRYPLAR